MPRALRRWRTCGESGTGSGKADRLIQSQVRENSDLVTSSGANSKKRGERGRSHRAKNHVLLVRSAIGTAENNMLDFESLGAAR